MSAVVYILPVVARIHPHDPQWREQYEREQWAKIWNDGSPPPRTRPILIRQSSTETEGRGNAV